MAKTAQKMRKSYTVIIWEDLFKRALGKINAALLPSLDWSIINYMQESGKLSPEAAAVQYAEIKCRRAFKRTDNVHKS